MLQVIPATPGMLVGGRQLVFCLTANVVLMLHGLPLLACMVVQLECAAVVQCAFYAPLKPAAGCFTVHAVASTVLMCACVQTSAVGGVFCTGVDVHSTINPMVDMVVQHGCCGCRCLQLVEGPAHFVDKTQPLS